MDEQQRLARITVNPDVFGGKPIIRGRRLAVEHVLGMLAAGDTPDILLQGYPWLEREDISSVSCLRPSHRRSRTSRMKVLLDTCVWGGAKAELETVGHDVAWTGDLAEDPGDEAILAQGRIGDPPKFASLRNRASREH